MITRRNGDRFVVLYDEDDRDTVLGHRWNIQPTRTPGRYYVKTQVQGRTVYLHQLIGGKGVDHVNRDGLDNRRANLRAATSAQNAANRLPVRAGLKGVTRHRSGKWQAAIAKKYIGLFETEAEAAAAYDAAALAKWGEHAYLNGALS